MKLFDTKPTIRIDPHEFKRLLGLPPEYMMEGRVEELARWAENWYEKHGNPWIHAKQIGQLEVEKNGGSKSRGKPCTTHF